MFRITCPDEEQALLGHLRKQALPQLIVKIIGTDNEPERRNFRASIVDAFKQVMCTMMKQTSEYERSERDRDVVRVLERYLALEWHESDDRMGRV